MTGVVQLAVLLPVVDDSDGAAVIGEVPVLQHEQVVGRVVASVSVADPLSGSATHVARLCPPQPSLQNVVPRSHCNNGELSMRCSLV